MTQTESPDAFRKRSRSWITKNLPPADVTGGLEVDDDAELRMISQARELQRLIFDAGFAGIRYPVEFGGQG